MVEPNTCVVVIRTMAQLRSAKIRSGPVRQQVINYAMRTGEPHNGEEEGVACTKLRDRRERPAQTGREGKGRGAGSAALAPGPTGSGPLQRRPLVFRVWARSTSCSSLPGQDGSAVEHLSLCPTPVTSGRRMWDIWGPDQGGTGWGGCLCVLEPFNGIGHVLLKPSRTLWFRGSSIGPGRCDQVSRRRGNPFPEVGLKIVIWGWNSSRWDWAREWEGFWLNPGRVESAAEVPLSKAASPPQHQPPLCQSRLLPLHSAAI